MSNNALSISGLSKSFGGLVVTDDVSFDVPTGSITALIGPNGAGKTTVFNLLTGVYPIDSGVVTLDGKNITHVPAQDRISNGLSRSFQNIRLMPHLNAVENVMLGQHSRARSLRHQLFPLGLVPGNRWVAQAKRTLHDAGLEEYPGQIVADLPYGIQKRIEIVRAIVSEPSVLLLDEPAAGLNEAETEELLALLQRVAAKGITILVIEHDMHFVRNLCDNVVVLNFGRKIFEGSPDQVALNPDVREAFLGSDEDQTDDAGKASVGGVANAT
ncbi:ABC transporter ATP-binding protein [Pacificibacter sp.]|uniref:ABC transporter ATP-binding protein n=1 Tax=Pacificibacter sp. TaxID=1917866 RepID=UPI00321BDFBE